MRSRTTHQLDKVPVFASRVTVALNITNQFAVSLTSRIETKTGLNLLVLQVTVNSLGATNYLNAILLGSIVLSQNTCICIRVITTDNNQCFDTEFTQNLNSALKLSFLLKLCTTRTYNVETTSVTIFVYKSISKLDVLMINQTARTHKETIQFAVRIE